MTENGNWDGETPPFATPMNPRHANFCRYMGNAILKFEGILAELKTLNATVAALHLDQDVPASIEHDTAKGFREIAHTASRVGYGGIAPDTDRREEPR